MNGAWGLGRGGGRDDDNTLVAGRAEFTHVTPWACNGCHAIPSAKPQSEHIPQAGAARSLFDRLPDRNPDARSRHGATRRTHRNTPWAACAESTMVPSHAHVVAFSFSRGDKVAERPIRQVKHPVKVRQDDYEPAVSCRGVSGSTNGGVRMPVRGADTHDNT